MREFLNKSMVKKYLLYILIILLSIVLMEFAISTKWAGFIFSLFSAYLNFFKIVAITTVVDKLKKLIEKWNMKGGLRQLLEFAIKFPVPMYSIYLLWYVGAAIFIYRVTENDIAANIALQNGISMLIGILVGIIAFLQDRTKRNGLSRYRESYFFACKRLANC